MRRKSRSIRPLWMIVATLLLVALLAFASGMLARKTGFLSDSLAYVPAITATEPAEPGVTYSRIFPGSSDHDEYGLSTNRLSLDGVDGSVFAFVDQTGEMQFWFWGTRIKYREGDPPLGEIGYFPVEIFVETVQDRSVFSAVYPPNVAMEKDVTSSFGQCIPMEYPDPDHLPEGLTKVDGTDLYAQGLADSRRYFIYGAFEGKEAHFWPANKTGGMRVGSLPVIPHPAVDRIAPWYQYPLTVRQLDTCRPDGSAAMTTVIYPAENPILRRD